MRNPIAVLLTLAVLSSASGCAAPVVTLQKVPPVQDLSSPAKPVPADDVATSDKAADDYDAAIEAWGDGMKLQIDRVCRWAKDLGAPVTCPGATPPSP
jgi:hypothetical protein